VIQKLSNVHVCGSLSYHYMILYLLTYIHTCIQYLNYRYIHVHVYSLEIIGTLVKIRHLLWLTITWV